MGRCAPVACAVYAVGGRGALPGAGRWPVCAHPFRQGGTAQR
ncbi:hypothetical protein SANTM175S_06905 [Streptomyces antimycoticus]